MNRLIEIENDRFHDHCGVCGVFGHPEAAKMAYLGLYALQHRGQESAGIVSSDGTELYLHRAMGDVEEIFQPSELAKLPGTLAIGHTRYSTAGDKALLNAQPIMIDCNKGKVALGHNGNLTNAAEWRRRLEHRGSIFQTNSDTEVIVHLIARSQARNLSGALGDALNQVEGAYSLLVLLLALFRPKPLFYSLMFLLLLPVPAALVWLPLSGHSQGEIQTEHITGSLFVDKVHWDAGLLRQGRRPHPPGSVALSASRGRGSAPILVR